MRLVFKKYFNILLYVLSFISLILFFDLNDYLLIVLIGLLSFIIFKYINVSNNKIVLVFSIFFSICLNIGKCIYNTYDINSLFSDYKYLFCLFFMIPFIYKLFLFVVNKLNSLCLKEDTKYFKKKHLFALIFFVQFLSFVITWLALYPGVYTYDVYVQTMQAFGIINYYALQPPIHTFLMEFAFRLENISGIQMIIFYTIPQILFMSYSLTKFTYYLIKKHVSKILVYITLIFFILNPVVSMFSLICTKDPYFSGLFLLLIVEFLEIINNKEYFSNKINIIRFICICILACLFRNNFIYVVITFLLIILIFYRKQFNIYKFSITLASSIILFYIITIPGYKLLNIDKGSVREMLSVPMQQIGLVVCNHYDELSLEEITMINKYINIGDVKSTYNMRLADPIKDMFINNQGKSDYIKVYFRLLKRYPSEYISAFLNLNIPYWYLEADTYDPINEREYIEIKNSHNPLYSVERNSKIKFLEKIYYKIGDYSLIDKIPIINIIFSLSFPIWIMLFTLVIMIIRKNYKQMIILLPGIILWLTYLLGPTSCFRYVFPMFLCYPLFMVILFDSKHLFKND